MSNNYLLKPSKTVYPINGTPGYENIRDYQHAARIFVDNNYALSPKYGFLFYVEFDFNKEVSNLTQQKAQEMGMVVKSVDLPRFTINTKIYNAYNKKNIIQSRINYDQVMITFHDDQSDLIRKFWYDYYNFYYRDSDYNESLYRLPSYLKNGFDWGYGIRPAKNTGSGNNTGTSFQAYQYIQSIRIYSLHQKKFSEYQLINPIITNFNHGRHANGDNGVMEHTMTVQYETVKYHEGYTTPATAGGYIDLHYDNIISPLANPNIIDFTVDTTLATSTVTDLVNQIPAYPPIPPAAPDQGALPFNIPNVTAQSRVPTVPSLLGSVVTPTVSAGATTVVAAATSSAVGSVSGVINGTVTGTATSLGSSSTLLSIGAAAFANPKTIISVAENMAIKQATNYATSLINTGIGQATGYLQKQVSGISQPFLDSALKQAQTLGSSISKSFGDAGQSVKEFVGGLF